ncbi:Serine/arginine-rich splicing factor 4, partial [Stegodyphus mimosarum]
MGTRVYIGRLSYDCRERDLERFLKGYGKIREILIKNGFGFVEFDDYRDADDAVYELNGKDLLGERMHVEIARGPRSRDDSWNSWHRNRNRRTPMRRWGRKEKYGPPTRTEYRLIVENLSSKVSWQKVLMWSKLNTCRKRIRERCACMKITEIIKMLTILGSKKEFIR